MNLFDKQWQHFVTDCPCISFHFNKRRFSQCTASDWFCVIWVMLVIFVSVFVVCKRISLKITDNVLADDAWIRFPFCSKCVVQCGCFKLTICGLCFSVDFRCYMLMTVWQTITFCSWLSVHFGPLQFSVLQSISLHQMIFYGLRLPDSFCVSNLLWCAYESLWQTVITFCSWMSVHFVAHQITSFQSMSQHQIAYA